LSVTHCSLVLYLRGHNSLTRVIDTRDEFAHPLSPSATSAQSDWLAAQHVVD